MATALDATETELQYLLAIEAGYYSEAARIVSAWDAHLAARKVRDRRIGAAIMGASAAISIAAISLVTYLLTQTIF